ncbi:MAG: 16S rRNA (guanine(527)-N(7))-methyltransferase RsmG [Phycisphaerales bacterium]|nr:MAG: 16S rRNA (guanine(527)-N(7))-methyltransferase RsmG [Phycisphaerales bacterium]
MPEPRRTPKPASNAKPAPAPKPKPRPKGSKPTPAPRAPIVFDLPAAPLPAPASFTAGATALGIEFEPGDVERLGLYLAALLKANESANMTAIREPEEAWTKHILDALTLLPVLSELPEGGTVADVGSGGGVPAIPLAIVSPHLRFHLFESTGKKAAFLAQAAAHAGCANVTVHNLRAEAAGLDRGENHDAAGVRTRVGGHRDTYDLGMCRALGPLRTSLELVLPLVKPEGLAVFVKGQKAEEELVEAKQALYVLHASHAGTVDTPTGKLVIIEKRRATPKGYPRIDGLPKRKPL